jgi:hypothetical protein
MAHTPGPWRVFGDSIRQEDGTPWCESHPICRVANANGAVADDCVDPDSDANARLIAAAPELLEAVEALVKRGQKRGQGAANNWWEMELAANAIAKAQEGA